MDCLPCVIESVSCQIKLLVTCDCEGVPASPTVNSPSIVIPGAATSPPEVPIGDSVPRSEGDIGFETTEVPSKRIKPARATFTTFELKACVSARTSIAFWSSSFVGQPGTVAAFGENGKMVGARE